MAGKHSEGIFYFLVADRIQACVPYGVVQKSLDRQLVRGYLFLLIPVLYESFLGNVLGRFFAADYLKGKIDKLHFSKESSEKEHNDKGSGVPCLDLVKQSIAIAKSLGEHPDIIFTVFRENLDQLEKIYREIILPKKLLLIINTAIYYN